MHDLMHGTIAEDFIDAKANAKNRKVVLDGWHLGPAAASIDPQANASYWQEMAKLWAVTPTMARRRLCANCEYFDNTPGRQAQMEGIPLEELDWDGGGRGYCTKFTFVCHNLRTCQAWEEKEFEAE